MCFMFGSNMTGGEAISALDAGLRVYEQASSGDIVRSESAIFEDAWSVVKHWEPQKPGAPLASVMGVKNFRLPNKPYRRLMTEALTPLFEDDYTMVDAFMGAGGFLHGMKPPNYIGNELQHGTYKLHEAALKRPELFDPEAVKNLAFTREGEIPHIQGFNPKSGLTQRHEIGGPVTEDEIEQYGMPEHEGVYYGVNFFPVRAQYNRLMDKEKKVGLTDDEYVDMIQAAWFLTKNAQNQSFRYSKDMSRMNMPGPRPRASKKEGFRQTTRDIWDAGQVNEERFGIDTKFALDHPDYKNMILPYHDVGAKGHGVVPEWVKEFGFSQPAYYAAGHKPHAIDMDMMEQHETMKNANAQLHNLDWKDFMRIPKPDKSVTVLDPPYRQNTGQHHWNEGESDRVGQTFYSLGKAGKPVIWYDDYVPENLHWVEKAGGSATIISRREHNMKSKLKTAPEMFAWVNMPHLDPEEVASWTDSKGM